MAIRLISWWLTWLLYLMETKEAVGKETALLVPGGFWIHKQPSPCCSLVSHNFHQDYVVWRENEELTLLGTVNCWGESLSLFAAAELGVCVDLSCKDCGCLEPDPWYFQSLVWSLAWQTLVFRWTKSNAICLEVSSWVIDPVGVRQVQWRRGSPPCHVLEWEDHRVRLGTGLLCP